MMRDPFLPALRGRRWRRGFAIAASLLALGACAHDRTLPAASEAGPVSAVVAAPAPPAAVAEPAAAPPDKVALLLPLTGPAAPVGRMLLDAAQMAVFELADEEFAFHLYDTAGQPAAAADAVQRAVDDGAAIIIGPLFAASTRAAAPVAAGAGVPLVAFTNDRAVAGGGVFILGLLPEQQVRRIVGFAYGRALRRFGLLAPDNGFGRAVGASLQAVAAETGATITRQAMYDPTEGDLNEVAREFAEYDERRAELFRQRRALEARDDAISRQALARLRDLDTLGDPPYDALLLPEGGAALRQLAPLLAFYDVDPGAIRLLGTAQWAGLDPDAEPALRGGWYTAPSLELRAAFAERYRRAFRRQPSILASLAYDAIALAVALHGGPDGPDYSPAALRDPAGFAGIDGIFRFLDDGTNQRGLAVFELDGSAPQLIDPAPAGFADPES